MKVILDLATIAMIGFTAVVAAWMVVRGLRRTSTRLMFVIGAMIVLAGALQLVPAPTASAGPVPIPPPSTDIGSSTPDPASVTPAPTTEPQQPTSATDPPNDQPGDTHFNPHSGADAPGGERIAGKPRTANNTDTAATDGSTTATTPTTPTTHVGQNKAGAKP